MLRINGKSSCYVDSTAKVPDSADIDVFPIPRPVANPRLLRFDQWQEENSDYIDDILDLLEDLVSDLAHTENENEACHFNVAQIKKEFELTLFRKSRNLRRS